QGLVQLTVEPMLVSAKAQVRGVRRGGESAAGLVVRCVGLVGVAALLQRRFHSGPPWRRAGRFFRGRETRIKETRFWPGGERNARKKERNGAVEPSPAWSRKYLEVSEESSQKTGAGKRLPAPLV